MNYHSMYLRQGLLALILCLLATSATAQMYRYQDEDGNPVISNSVPQEAVQRGYEVLSPSGRVIEVIDPAPTEEERAERRRRAEEQAREEEQRRLQAESDRQLMRQYSSPDDVVRTLHRTLREMYSLVRLRRGNITSLEAQLQEEETQAANMERAGREIPQQTHDTMDRLRQQIDELQQEITEELARMDATREEYRVRIERMETLTEQRRSMPLTIPEEREDASAP